ncbi:LysM peptidoglycan-binding domain-containing protein [Sesbania bispinosa]|nr:LysM peptidoglycan-binding domain-containing protein [Sesbania bispinosa]
MRMQSLLDALPVYVAPGPTDPQSNVHVWSGNNAPVNQFDFDQQLQFPQQQQSFGASYPTCRSSGSAQPVSLARTFPVPQPQPVLSGFAAPRPQPSLLGAAPMPQPSLLGAAPKHDDVASLAAGLGR